MCRGAPGGGRRGWYGKTAPRCGVTWSLDRRGAAKRAGGERAGAVPDSFSGVVNSSPPAAFQRLTFSVGIEPLSGAQFHSTSSFDGFEVQSRL